MRRRAFLAASVATAATAHLAASENLQNRTRKLIVMDPLALPLACDCVKGYAQRDYSAFAKYLSEKTGQTFEVVFADSLSNALEKSGGAADLIVGKESVIQADARELKKSLRPLAKLTDLKDAVTQTGLLVVRSDDAAKSVKDLQGYRIVFGPSECEEKSEAICKLLKSQGIAVPEQKEVASSCSEAVSQMMDCPATERIAAVVSSYATPLLEGCGKVAKGDLRIVGETAAVPFITLFATPSIDAASEETLRAALEETEWNAQLLVKLESVSGFKLCEPVA